MLSSLDESGMTDLRDPVWIRLCLECEDIAQNEPVLRRFVDRAILSHSDFGQAVAGLLAIKLGGAEVNSEDLASVFGEAIGSGQGIVASAKADLLAIVDRDPACHRLIDPFLFFKGWQAVQAHRIAHHFWKRNKKDLAYFIQSRTSSITSTDIHPAARIGNGIMIDHAHDVVIGETCVIEDNVSLMQGVTLGGNGKETGDRQPKIRQGVLIGAGAKILGNIEIGRGSRVAAGSVVLHSVPPNTTVAGIPAKVVGSSGSTEPARIMNHQIEADEG